jgi:hypothetical protein
MNEVQFLKGIQFCHCTQTGSSFTHLTFQWDLGALFLGVKGTTHLCLEQRLRKSGFLPLCLPYTLA